MTSERDLKLVYSVAVILFIVGLFCYAAFPVKPPDEPLRIQYRSATGNVLFEHAKHLFELADLGLQAVGHAVEGRREPGEVVLAPDRHPLAEVPGLEPLCDRRGSADRGDGLAGDEPGDLLAVVAHLLAAVGDDGLEPVSVLATNVGPTPTVISSSPKWLILT